jgi:hypoxanthine phosphoribosyltransferase
MAAVHFAHAAELEIANLLSFYGLEWRYEPEAFPIAFAVDGQPTSFFAPDFFVPALDLYIEVTAARSNYCRLKHRKIRAFQILYPTKHIKLLNRHDIEALLIRTGQFRRIAEVSGRAGESIVKARPAAIPAQGRARPKSTVSSPR